MIKINRIGYNYTHNNGIKIHRPYGTGDYLLLCIKTPALISSQQMIHNINEPCFIIYDKGIPQDYESCAIPYINDWIHFDSADENIKTIIDDMGLPFDTPIFVHNARILSAKIQSLAQEFWKLGKHSDKIIDLEFKALLYSLSDTYLEEAKTSDKLNRYRGIFNEIRSDIYTYKENNNHNVDYYASKISLSTSYFQHIYKNLFGVPVTHDIIQSRINYACTLLLSNFDSITDIAERCGYDSPEHFTRQFKEYTGYTPRQFRQETFIGDSLI